VKGTTSALKKDRYKHFALIENGGDKLTEQAHTNVSREGNEVKVKWYINQEMFVPLITAHFHVRNVNLSHEIRLFALSSKIKVVIYSKGNLFKHKVGQYDGYFMDLVGKG